MSVCPIDAAPPGSWTEGYPNVTDDNTAYFYHSLQNPENTSQSNTYAIIGQYSMNAYNSIGSMGNMLLGGWRNMGARFKYAPPVVPTHITTVTSQWNAPIECTPSVNHCVKVTKRVSNMRNDIINKM